MRRAGEFRSASSHSDPRCAPRAGLSRRARPVAVPARQQHRPCRPSQWRGGTANNFPLVGQSAGPLLAGPLVSALPKRRWWRYSAVAACSRPRSPVARCRTRHARRSSDKSRNRPNPNPTPKMNLPPHPARPVNRRDAPLTRRLSRCVRSSCPAQRRPRSARSGATIWPAQPGPAPPERSSRPAPRKTFRRSPVSIEPRRSHPANVDSLGT
jgi:hypothetical protein